MSRTFCLLKPDAVSRNVVGCILEILGGHFRILNLAMIMPTRAQVEDHYKEHEGRAYFDDLVDFMLTGPVVAAVLEHLAPEVESVTALRQLMGSYKREEFRTGTIRKRFMTGGDPAYKNLIHGSDGDVAADREANIWFQYPAGASFHGAQFPPASHATTPNPRSMTPCAVS